MVYNLFRYCHNDPIDNVDPMGTIAYADAPITNPEIQAYYTNARDVMAKWADSSNNFQGTFAQFAAQNGLTMGQQVMGAQVHDPVKNGKNYLQSSNYSAVGIAIAKKAEEQLQQNPSEHEELSIISRNKDGTMDFIASPPQPQFYNGKTLKNFSNVYDRNDPRQVDPSPPGYRAVANVVAQKLWVPFIDPKDRANIHKTGLDAFIAVPGRRGTNQSTIVRFYNEGNVFPIGY